MIVPINFATIRANRLGVEDRARLIKKVLLGGAADLLPMDRAPSEDPTRLMPWQIGVREAVSVSHESETDDLLLVNRAVANDHSIDSDIGESAARQIFEDTVAQLASEGTDDVSGLDLRKVKVSRLRQASMQTGKPETLRSGIKAYVFSAPRTVNEYPILNSDVTISVHRSGKLASIRSRGVLPGAALVDARGPVAKSRVVGSDAILKRVRAEHPEADVHSFGLMYVVGTAADTSAGAAVEPREVVMVFDRSNDGSGVRSRGKMVSYSVTDEAAPAVDLYSQLKDDLGDPRK